MFSKYEYAPPTFHNFPHLNMMLSRSMTISEKKRIGSITTHMAKKKFNERTLHSRSKFVVSERSKSLVRVLREKRSCNTSYTVDKFITSGMTYDTLDVCVKGVPGIGESQKNTLDEHGVEKISDLIDIFFELEEKGGVGGPYELFEKWLKNIGISVHTDTITMCISAKWYMLVAKGQDHRREIGRRCIVKNIGGILTIGICSCLLLF